MPYEWTRSAALEVGGALLGERARAFLGVVGPEDGLPVLELVGKRFLLGHAVGFAQGAEDGLDRERAVVVDRLCDLERLRERVTVGHDVADEADPRCFFGGDVLGGEEDLRRVHRNGIAIIRASQVADANRGGIPVVDRSAMRLRIRRTNTSRLVRLRLPSWAEPKCSCPNVANVVSIAPPPRLAATPFLTNNLSIIPGGGSCA